MTYLPPFCFFTAGQGIRRLRSEYFPELPSPAATPNDSNREKLENGGCVGFDPLRASCIVLALPCNDDWWNIRNTARETF